MVTVPTNMKPEILILGAGWTSTFLFPLLEKENIKYVATTTTGRDHTLKFQFNYDGESKELSEESQKQLASLPTAQTVLITFPLKGKGQSAALHKCYTRSHSTDSDAQSSSRSDGSSFQFIQLGSSGIFSIREKDTCWITRHSKYNSSDARAIAEDELLGLGGCVLNLSGLWGGARQVIHWLDRVAATKEQLKGKESLHMIHGRDVAGGIVGVHRRFDKARGERFVTANITADKILTDLFVYDWWALVLGFAGELDNQNGNDDRAKTQIKWIGELMQEEDVKALPRSMERLGRCYDTREFWDTFGIMPVRARI